jgi:hypothetical protein
MSPSRSPIQPSNIHRHHQRHQITQNSVGTRALMALKTCFGGTTVNRGILASAVGGNTGKIRGILNINSGAIDNADTNRSLGCANNVSASAMIIISGDTLNCTGIARTAANSITGNTAVVTNAGSVSSAVATDINLRLGSGTLNIVQGTFAGGVELAVSEPATAELSRRPAWARCSSAGSTLVPAALP